MGYRPIISKIRVFHPNKSGARRSNYNYLHYIATREGTDLTNLLYLDEDQVADLNVDLNEKGEDYFHNTSGDEVYLKYIANRPNSHGLFGNIPTEDFSEVSKRLNEVSDSGRTVYRDIISLSETDAKALGFYDKRKWDIYLREVLPDVVRVLGLSQNDFTWVAAYHAEPTHPHVHIMFWDNKDKVRSSFIHSSDQEKIRKICEKAMFSEENEKIIRRFTQAERDEYYSLKNASRDAVTDFFKDIFRNKVLVPGESSEILPGRISKEIHDQLMEKYKTIISSLPSKGRMAYKYMPEECKRQIDEVTSLFFQQSDIEKEYQSYLEAEKNIQKMSGKTEKEIEWKLEAARKDLYKRTGNIILKGISKMQQEILEEESFHNNLINDDGQPKQETEPETMFAEDIEEKVVNREAEVPEDDYKVETDTSEQSLNDKKIENEADENKLNTGYIKGYFDWNAKNQAMELYYNDKSDEILIQRGMDQLVEEAEKGNILCMEQLAQIYKYKSGICESKKEQGELLEVSESYQKEAVRTLDGLIKSMEGIPLDKQEAYVLSYANYRMGYHYLKGQGVDKDVIAAEEYLAKSSQKYAHYWRGKIYSSPENGESLWNMDDAIKQYKIAADAGHAYAAFALGKIFEDNNSEFYNIEDSIKYYKRASDGGVLLADIALAKIYINKLSDIKAAVNKLEYAIKKMEKQKTMDPITKGIWENAKISLAKIYMDKSFGTRNYEKAFQILEGIEDERGMAYYYKGKMHIDKNEKYYDLDKAIDNFQKAEKAGNTHAIFELGKIYLDKGDYLKMEQYYLKGIEAGDFRGYLFLADAYSNKNPVAAEKYLKDLIDKVKSDHTEGEKLVQKEYELVDSANKRLAKLYLDRLGLYNPNEALEILRKCKENKSTFYLLGKAYSDNESIHYDMKKAISYFERSADQGNSAAMYKLGKIYLYGIGVKRNEDLAKYWLQKSAFWGNESAIESLKKMENMDFSKYSYALLRQILNSVHMTNNQNKQKLHEREFSMKGKQQKREEYLHHN